MENEQNSQLPPGNYDKCLIADCENKASSRGLCSSCYMAARAALKKSGGSWDSLVEKGLAKPSKKAGRKSGSKRQEPFIEALS